MDDQQGLLSVKEAAQLLTIKESTVRDWVLRKKLPIVRVGEKLIRIRRAELLKLVVDEKA
jgi:excisionase family DNA binding protein